ncbi:hypothetical protein GNP89_18860 [Aliivibrio fischeri]|uniref:hypothetical protein n=1 Tax=Aliivibrio fischeri TaxID=668 RepID=UPI0012D9EA08|nr:hypothetical protein [Aliivibrio fischeri]MUL04226.1 hypothetical protein [Aliivibrio fischeri]
MKTKKFSSKEKLKQWAKTTAGVVLTSITLINSVQSIEFNFPTTKALSTVMENAPTTFPEGEYKVSFSNSDDIELDDLDYSKMAMVMSIEAKLANRDILIGGLQPLMRELNEFTYCCTIDRTNPVYYIASIWVVEPTEPEEVKSLESVLEQYSVFYAFNDGSGFVTLNNARMGKGISQLVEI